MDTHTPQTQSWQDEDANTPASVNTHSQIRSVWAKSGSFSPNMKTSTSVFEKKKVRMTGTQRVKQHEDYPSGSEGLTVEAGWGFDWLVRRKQDRHLSWPRVWPQR